MIMKNEKFKPIKFDSWQELAKYVIDGGEVYYKSADCKNIEICFSGVGFNCDVERIFGCRDLYTKKQPTLEELIAIKPRLCWVCYKNKKFLRLILNVDEFGFFVDDNGCAYDNSQMLTDDEIKQFLNGE